MATAINRITLAYYTTADTPKFPAETYILNPDLSAVEGVPKRYWKISGDSVVEMTQAEKDAVDLVRNQAFWDRLEAEVESGVFRALMAALIKRINVRLPSGQGITAAEMKAAIRQEIEAQSSV